MGFNSGFKGLMEKKDSSNYVTSCEVIANKSLKVNQSTLRLRTKHCSLADDEVIFFFLKKP
jgi:hypothetical protein